MVKEIDGVEQWQPDQNEDPDQMDNEDQGQEEQEEQGQEDQPEEEQERRDNKPEKKKKSTRKKIKEAQKRAKKAKKHTKRVAENVKKSTRRLSKTGQKAGKAIKKATAPARAAARKVAQQVLRMILQMLWRLLMQMIKLAMKVAQAAIKIIAQIIQFLVSNPIGWVVLLIILIITIVMLVVNLFINDKNEEAGGLGGGSQSIEANYNIAEHRDLVDNLLAKTQSVNPSLVLSGSSSNDLNWVETVINEETGETITTHPLDLRVLKAIEYLTDLHEYIEIGMLRTDAPDWVRDAVIVNSEAVGGENEQLILDTLSAFSTGQAFSIIAVDRTKIPELVPSSGDAPPINVSWQKTLIERAIRPLWEELTFNIGVLDRNLPVYKAVLGGTYEDYGEAFNVGKNLFDAIVSGDAELYKNSFRTLKRIVTLLDRALGLEDYLEIDLTNAHALDSRTIKYLSSARDQLYPLVDYIENNILKITDLDDIESGSDSIKAAIDFAAVVEAVKYLGQTNSLERMHYGARFIYKATQVANMVGWDKATNLDLKKAYEARNKIRQVIKELLEMPREVSLYSNTSFDETMVAKQIITFSPEDDLDNGPERMDVYPYGIKSVDIGGIAMDVLTGDGIADGVIDYPDIHFSHSPKSANGVFSKGGANYIDKISPDTNPLENALSFMDEDEIEGQSDAMHKLLVGECVLTAGEDCQKSSYKNYIYVAF